MLTASLRALIQKPFEVKYFLAEQVNNFKALQSSNNFFLLNESYLKKLDEKSFPKFRT